MRYEIRVNMIFTDSSSSSLLLHEEPITVAVYTRLKLLHENRFSSDLVHRHIIFPLTLLRLEKLMIITPDNTLMQAVPMSKQVNRVKH